MACFGARSTLLFALLAYYGRTKMRLAPFARGDPRPGYPWRIVPDVLRVAAFKLCDPIVLLALLESNNLSVKHFFDAELRRVRMPRAHKLYGNPNVNNAVPAATATYCFPSTAYVFGEE